MFMQHVDIAWSSDLTRPAASAAGPLAVSHCSARTYVGLLTVEEETMETFR